ncbi:hypothetical protein X802_08385 [Thermococcus guaymasensis DSM 11113]|uniref:Uncharacterized protein n=1 Tax=Thermococcus guaymasensis DSM 11113 TaxID=1432656 RepID=A0A0X1KNE8_9EURY|nr:hypothetical protein [Thermococcus guaymasensis]AJC72787.1 hypothetical protein X802_08385 [Thermococcus guaymasensis DSM 11113]
MEKINEVWILASELGMYSHKGNSYWVIRKYKRKKGYSARDVERLFSGYTNSGKTQKFETFEELVQFLTGEHPTRKNYGFPISARDILKALEKLPPEGKEFWREEIEYLRGLLGKPVKEWNPQPKPTRQTTLDGLVKVEV